LEQARGAVGHVLDEHLAAAVQQQAVQRRLVWVLCNGGARFLGPAGSGCEDVDGIPGRVLEQEPVYGRLAQRLEIAETSLIWGGASHHPPASASALWYACVTATSSRPLSDMLGAEGLRRAAAGCKVQQSPAEAEAEVLPCLAELRRRCAPRGQRELLVRYGQIQGHQGYQGRLRLDTTHSVERVKRGCDGPLALLESQESSAAVQPVNCCRKSRAERAACIILPACSNKGARCVLCS
jgi:hypothetical protein